MATDAADAKSHNARVKLVTQLLVHVPFWTLVLWSKTMLVRSGAMQAAGSSEHWAMVVGFSVIGFGLIALGLGACAPYLRDSEEAHDLRRESPALLLGAVALLSSGASLIVVSLAGSGRLLSAGAGVTAALLLNVCATVFAAVRLRRMDELNRGVAREAGHLAFMWLSWVGGTWAILAHLEFVKTPAPLDWLTMFYGFSFIAGLVALARKGGFAAQSHSVRSHES